MSLMLLSQASLFADKGLIGADGATQVVMSKNGNIVISYNTTNIINLYKKTAIGWERQVNSLSGISNVKEVKLSEDGAKVAISYRSGSDSTYANRIQVCDLNTSTLVLTYSLLISSASNIWYFDVNALAVVYTIPGSSLQLYRFSDSSTQTISFTEISGSSGAWFTSNSSLNFRWAGQDSASGINSIGTVSVLSASTFTRVVRETNIQSSFSINSDFSRGTFAYVGSGTSTSCFVVDDNIVQTFTIESFFGLPFWWQILDTKISDDGNSIAVVLNDTASSSIHRLYLLTRGSTDFSIAGFIEYNTPQVYGSVLAVNSTLREFLVETNLGPKNFIV